MMTRRLKVVPLYGAFSQPLGNATEQGPKARGPILSGRKRFPHSDDCQGSGRTDLLIVPRRNREVVEAPRASRRPERSPSVGRHRCLRLPARDPASETLPDPVHQFRDRLLERAIRIHRQDRDRRENLAAVSMSRRRRTLSGSGPSRLPLDASRTSVVSSGAVNRIMKSGFGRLRYRLRSWRIRSRFRREPQASMTASLNWLLSVAPASLDG